MTARQRSETEDRSDRQSVLGVPMGVIVLGIARMADGFGNSFLIVVLPLYIDSGQVSGDLLRLSPAAISGVVLGLFGLVLSFAQPFTGRLSDRLGRRQPLILLGLIVLAVANVSFTFAGTYTGLLWVRLAQGVGAALTITASVALVNELSSRDTRGTNMGVYNSFRLFGFGGGPLVAGVVVSAGPYRLGGVVLSGFDAAFAIAGLAAALSAAAVLVFVRDTPWTHANQRRVALRLRGTDTALDTTFVLGIATLVMAASIALLATIEPLVNERLAQGPVMFSVQFAALIAALAVLQPVTGRWSDRLGRATFVFWGLVALVPAAHWLRSVPRSCGGRSAMPERRVGSEAKLCTELTRLGRRRRVELLGHHPLAPGQCTQCRGPITARPLRTYEQPVADLAQRVECDRGFGDHRRQAVVAEL